jgi:hypothetical protein
MLRFCPVALLLALRCSRRAGALLALEHVDIRTRELAGAHAVLEQQVQLGERAARGLGNAEVRVNDAEEADATLRNRDSSVKGRLREGGAGVPKRMR